MNRLALQITLIFTFNLFVTAISVCSMVPLCIPGQQDQTEKPLIQAKLFINHNSCKNLCYVSDSRCNSIESNSSISAPRNMPVIPVVVTFIKANNKEAIVWNDGDIPTKMLHFEVQCHKQQKGVTSFSVADSIVLLKQICKERAFFKSLPIAFVWAAKTRSILKCTIFGYPVELTCCGNKKITGTFENDCKQIIEAFIQEPLISGNLTTDHTIEKGFIDKKVVAIVSDSPSYNKTYSHGESSKVTMIQNFLNFSRNKHKSNETILLLISLVQAIINADHNA